MLDAVINPVGATEELKRDLETRDGGIWRWRRLLPVDSEMAVSLGEGDTPLIVSLRLREETGLNQLYIKNDGVLPTGSLKDRAVSVAISHAKEIGAKVVSVASTGNNAASLAAYAGAADIAAVIFVPSNTAPSKIQQIRAHNPVVISVDSNFEGTAALCKQAIAEFGWYSTLSTNPWRAEGNKSYAFEIWEQLGRHVPKWVIHPTGGGLGLSLGWKGWKELNLLGLARGYPHLVAAQAAAAAHLPPALETGLDEPNKIELRPTIAESIAIGSSSPGLGWRLLKAVRETEGDCLAIEDSELLVAQKLLAKAGIFAEPSAAASLAAALKLKDRGRIQADDSVVCIVTGHGLKDPQAANAFAGDIIPVSPKLSCLKVALKDRLNLT